MHASAPLGPAARPGPSSRPQDACFLRAHGLPTGALRLATAGAAAAAAGFWPPPPGEPFSSRAAAAPVGPPPASFLAKGSAYVKSNPPHSQSDP